MQDPEVVAEVADRYRVGAKNASLVNEIKAGTDVVCRTLLDWKGEEPFFGKKLEVNDENKRLFLRSYVEASVGERVTLFQWIVRVAEDKEAVELKNS